MSSLISIRSFVLAFVFLITVGCSSSSFETSRHEYFRTRGSDNAPLASVGTKDQFLFFPFNFTKKEMLILPSGEFTVDATSDSFQEEQKRTYFKYTAREGSEQAEGAGSIDQKVKEGGRFIILRVRDGELMAALNDTSQKNAARDQALLWKDKIRVVNAIAVVFGHSSEEDMKITSGARILLLSGSGDAEFTYADNRKVRLTDGTIFAYQFVRPCWGTTDDKPGTLVVRSFATDRDGFLGDPPPPSGTFFNPDKVKLAGTN